MSGSVVFQPEWNGFPRRQFRHLERFFGAGVGGHQGLAESDTHTSEGVSEHSAEHAHGPGWMGRFALRGKCICLECGHEFGVQREGAMYVCERCAARAD